jgi:hypothetical protein
MMLKICRTFPLKKLIFRNKYRLKCYTVIKWTEYIASL